MTAQPERQDDRPLLVKCRQCGYELGERWKDGSIAVAESVRRPILRPDKRSVLVCPNPKCGHWNVVTPSKRAA